MTIIMSENSQRIILYLLKIAYNTYLRIGNYLWQLYYAIISYYLKGKQNGNTIELTEGFWIF